MKKYLAIITTLECYEPEGVGCIVPVGRKYPSEHPDEYLTIDEYLNLYEEVEVNHWFNDPYDVERCVLLEAYVSST